MTAIVFKQHKDARDALLRGVQPLADLVTTTLGPKGLNIVLDRMWGSPAIIHDGVSIAKEIELKDPFENIGARLVKEAAEKSADRTGDGTTTATLLAWKLIEKGFQLVEEGRNPQLMKEGMEIAATEVVKELKKQAVPVTNESLLDVATISAANEEIGKIISEAIVKIGKNGVASVEEGMGQETTVEYKEGMMFDKGYSSGSPYFITNREKLTVEIENPMILYTDMVIDSVQDFSDFLDNVLTPNDHNIVIIADRIEVPCLAILLENMRRGALKAYAVQAPSFGVKRIWTLEDMAATTGGVVLTKQSGRSLASLTKEDLGRADKVWADESTTKIIGGHGSDEVVQKRIKTLLSQVETQESEFEKKSIHERIAKLTGGAAIIKVGALTEVELKDKKERITDAVEATKSAIAEGIVAGGGIALLQCQNSLRHLHEAEGNDDKIAGIKLVIDVLNEPFKKILTNAGEKEEKIWTALITGHEEEKTRGYNVVTKEYGDMLEMGVIDPVKVTREALQNAVSVASMMITSDGLVTRDPEEKLTPQEREAPYL